MAVSTLWEGQGGVNSITLPRCRCWMKTAGMLASAQGMYLGLFTVCLWSVLVPMKSKALESVPKKKKLNALRNAK